MKKIIFLTITILILLSCVCIESAFSFSGTTHRILSDYAASNSVLNKDNYLVNYLGFQNGLLEPLKWEGNSQTVSLWMQDGAVLEDAGNIFDYIAGKARSLNHFHNPYAQDWVRAGLDDYITIPNPNPPYIPYQLHVTGKSAPVWGQDGAAQNNSPEKDWSWQKTRDLYYVALTSVTDGERQEYFAMMFRGLGHQMHLIEDMAVPEHVRNDAHPEQSIGATIGLGELYFEPWAAENDIFVTQRAQNPIPPTVSFETTINNYVPITQLTDVDQYNGTNPSTSTDIGLSEYTNANFFSDDTIFSAERYSSNDRHYFLYPNKWSTNLQNFINGEKILETTNAEDGISDTGIWISKTGDGEQIDHFVRPNYLTKIIYRLFGEGDLFYRTFYRDKVCYEDYVRKLVPRAVGYSAGLLDYFFRGKIEITEPLAVGGSISLLAENVTASGEEMTSGEIKLVAKYGLKDDTTNTIYYQVADADNKTSPIPKDNPIELSFPLTIPENAKDISLQVVYRGTLGKEEQAVAVGRIPYIPKPVIILYKNLGTEQEPNIDWWYYVVDEDKGVHKDPKASFPSNPEIISKWWSCDGMEEVEYYTRIAPAFQNPMIGGAGDNCGLTNFKSAQCCGSASGLPAETLNWTLSPCGGTPTGGARVGITYPASGG